MSKQPSNLKAQIEALLFAATEPISLSNLALLLNIQEPEAKLAIAELKTSLKNRGIGVVQGGDGYELAVQPDYRALTAKLADASAPTLSPSSMEVLTIIAYDGPVEKTHIDGLRGTPSDNSLRALLGRDLIIQLSDRESSDVIKYDLTSFAWRCLGIHGRDELPPKAHEVQVHAAE